MGDLNEQRVTAASYILNFFKDVGFLTHCYSNYVNFMLLLESKYGKDVDVKKCDPSDLNTLNETVQAVRYYSIKCNISLISIMKGTHRDMPKEIKDSFDKVKEKFIVKSIDIENYVQELNNILVDDVIQSLLENSQAIIDKLTGIQNQQQNEPEQQQQSQEQQAGSFIYK